MMLKFGSGYTSPLIQCLGQWKLHKYPVFVDIIGMRESLENYFCCPTLEIPV